MEKSAASTNGDLLAALDEAEAAWSVCADKVDTIISCQERNSEQTSVLTPRPEECRGVCPGQPGQAAFIRG
ncbi:TPA: hypothetical protein NPP80_003127 [Klebsiella variicola subsp. variicola]|nr:hypothetical protein [Klebsiella variicola subsp. variicola]HCK0343423.1 hypothetical protein [Klebsiella variicola subsp. variicola]